MFFYRLLEKVLKRYSRYPVIAILGPRQSGKTTLAKNYFKNHSYVNLEDPDFRSFAKEDPKRFLREFENPHGIILDEFQYVPEILSYIQVQSDEKKIDNYFILTGSQNFLMNSAITQSLAGRVGILTLLPLSLAEIEKNKLLTNLDKLIVDGSYPSLYERSLKPFDLYPSYIHTYIEKDVRQLTNVGDILVFQKFMKMCAARIGQQLNLSDLATNLGVDQRVIKNWLSILDASYITFFLKPYFNNFNKRITKTPKLYFYDTGLACSLLDIKTTESLSMSSYRGPLVECLITSDLYKQYYNLGLSPSLYFWRDANGRVEVDVIIDKGDKLIPVEIKSGETISHSFFKSLLEWNEISNTNSENNILVYAGDLNQSRSSGKIISWKKSGTLINNIYEDIE